MNSKNESMIVQVGDIVEHEEHGFARITDIETKAEGVGPNGPIWRIGVRFESGPGNAFFGGEVEFWDEFREGIIEVNSDAE